MRSGKCVKCGSATVRAARNGLGDSGHTTMWDHSEGRRRGIVRPHNGETWQFVCTSCGYLEWWVIDQETTQYIEENWVAVPPQS